MMISKSSRKVLQVLATLVFGYQMILAVRKAKSEKFVFLLTLEMVTPIKLIILVMLWLEITLYFATKYNSTIHAL